MICLAALSLLHGCLHFNETGQTLSPSASPVAAPLPAWIEILRPREIFHLETRNSRAAQNSMLRGGIEPGAAARTSGSSAV